MKTEKYDIIFTSQINDVMCDLCPSVSKSAGLSGTTYFKNILPCHKQFGIYPPRFTTGIQSIFRTIKANDHQEMILSIIMGDAQQGRVIYSLSNKIDNMNFLNVY